MPLWPNESSIRCRRVRTGRSRRVIGRRGRRRIADRPHWPGRAAAAGGAVQRRGAAAGDRRAGARERALHGRAERGAGARRCDATQPAAVGLRAPNCVTLAQQTHTHTRARIPCRGIARRVALGRAADVDGADRRRRRRCSMTGAPIGRRPAHARSPGDARADDAGVGRRVSSSGAPANASAVIVGRRFTGAADDVAKQTALD